MKRTAAPVRYDVSSIPDKFKLEVSNKCNALLELDEPETTPDGLWESMKGIMKTAADNHMPKIRKMDRIRNEIIRGTTKVGEIFKKVQESRLKWYGHVSRREDEYVGKRVMGMEVPGKRRRGRPKRRWLDSIRNDLSERGLSEEDAQDRPRWRRLIRHIDPT